MIYTSYIFLLLVTGIVVYAVMLMKFRNTRKRMEALQKIMEQEEFTKSKLSFHQTVGIFKKKVTTEIPGIEKQIQTKTMKNIENGEQIKDSNHVFKKRKRRSSSVVRGMSVLVSHIRAAKYVLVHVVVLLLTWGPLGGWLMYVNISHMINPYTMKRSGNPTMIWKCLNIALSGEKCTVDVGNFPPEEVFERVRFIAHLIEEQAAGYILAGFLNWLNSMINPILYAFMYVDFRKYLLMIPDLFKKKEEKPNDDLNFKIQVVKVN